MPLAITAPFRREFARAFSHRPFTLHFWDGTSVCATTASGPTLRVRSPKAVAYALLAPGQLGLGRAYVTGELELDDLDAVMEVVATWRPDPLERAQKARLALAAAAAAGLQRPPAAPANELRLHGERHSPERDAQAVRHHYDISNEFFALFLDASVTYSCAIFSRGATTLEAAQEAKLDLVATKLELACGERVLDVGCGWGSFAIHAASRYGVRVLGITLSPAQAEFARRRVAGAGLSEHVEIRIADYRDIHEKPFDAIASIGMVEHVGEERIDEYAARLHALLRPDGRLLNQGIARMRHTDPKAGPFSERYVWPDAEPLHFSRILLALERAGFECHHAEDFRTDYSTTLGHWIRRLDAHLTEAERLAGAERLRVWRLYLRAARDGFDSGFTSIYQVRASA